MLPEQPVRKVMLKYIENGKNKVDTYRGEVLGVT